MVEKLMAAAADDDVKSAIVNKISRERVGYEVNLMVRGNQPAKAMAYISELGLLWVVFTQSPNCEPVISDEHDRVCVEFMDVAWGLMHDVGCTFSDEHRRLYLYASLLIPLGKTVYIDDKNKTVPLVNYIFRNSLKLKVSDADHVMRLHNAVDKFLSLIPFVLSREEDMQTCEVNWETEVTDVPVLLKLRILLGLLLREIKDFWRAALMLFTFLYNNNNSSVEKRRDVFNEVEQEILKLGLDKVWEVEALVNGNDIIRLLELEKGGPVVGEWKQKLLQWKLAYPSGTVQECVDWMTRQMQLKRAGTLNYCEPFCSFS